MCNFKEQIFDKTVVGYKVAIVDKSGHYHSAITGIRYEKGKIPAPKTYGKHSIRSIIGINDILNGQSGYRELYQGHTAIFLTKSDADYLLGEWESTYNVRGHNFYNFVLLKIKLSGDIWTGDYNGNPVYIGSEIISIEKLK